MTVDLALLEAHVRRSVPAFRAEAVIARSVKCLVVGGRVGEARVVLKQLARDVAPWRWYFDRERALLTNLRAARSTTRTAALLGAGDDWMLLERIDGGPLARGRVARDLPEDRVAQALDARDRWAACDVALPDAAPDARTRAEMRDRLLEDPSDGLGWCLDGLRRGAALDLVDEATAARAIDALRAHPALRLSHGDLLPRNVIAAGDEVALIDLECAGLHPEAWDHALLWANVEAPLRAAVERHFGVDESPRGQAFQACVAFALVRERKFAREGPRAAALRETLAEVAARLA